MPLSISFKDQTILVTGGTRGIGEAIAREAIACQGNVIITGTGSEPPVWLTEIAEATPDQAIDYQQINFAEAGWTNRLDDIAAHYPNISTCINNAAINIISDIREVKLADLRKILEVNLVAPAMITSRLAQSMTKAGYGRFVNISSIFGVESRVMRSSYSASKAGLIGQTRAVALDLAPDGILVNAVCPGFVATDLTRQVLGQDGMAEVSTRIPVGHLADPADIVPPVLFLASRLNTYITGQVLVADGGYLVG
ncbi:MAG: SDR family oxidoreductase [Anaerolineae bacterium]|nr:SDR family oxidoreductase [Anaerolineae bacterium]